MTPLPRPLLPARFQRARLIGEGAVGAVYEVWDSERQEALALKTLHKASPSDVRELKREFRTVSELSHPNLVVLHELLFQDGLWFFTMELVRGKALVEPSGRSRTRNTERALRDRFLQLAQGICALHSTEILHRDIKPENILVEDSGRVVLLDFGLVHAIGRGFVVREGEYGLVGSPGYMAPEQVLGAPPSKASDWYAFGSTLYEALTGALPFESGPGPALMRKVSGEPMPIRQHGIPVSQDLASLCERLLAREADERPGAEEILQVLGTLESTPARLRASQMPPMRRIVGRRREMDEVGRWLRSASSGARMTIVAGPSGIGKTTFAESVLSELRRDGTLVLRSRCMTQEVVPFNAWDGLIDELSDRLADSAPGEQLVMDPALPRLFPVLASLQGLEPEWNALSEDPAEARSEGMRALRELFSRLCERQPVVLFIDDGQWADADSVRLLRELLLGSQAPPLGILVTVRPEEASSTDFGALTKDADFMRLSKTVELEPFLVTEASEFLADLGVLDAARQRRLAAEAQGNPFLLSVLARWGRPGGAGGAVPLTEVLEEQLASLPSTDRRLFETVGLLERPMPLEVALSAAGLPEGGLEMAHRLRAGGLLRWHGSTLTSLEVYHDQWRVALRRLLAESSRTERFTALALAYEKRGHAEDAEVLATCYRECGEPLRAAEAALRAASQAEETLAFDRAARCYEAALELGAWSDERRRELLVRLALMANAAGRGNRAGRFFQQAAELCQGVERVDLLRQAAQALLSSGRPEDGDAVLREVLRAVGSRAPKSASATLTQLLVERVRLRTRGLRWRPAPLSSKRRLLLAALEVAASTWVHEDPIKSWLFSQRLLRLALGGDDERLLLRAVSHELILSSAEIGSGAFLDELTRLGTELAERTKDPAARAWFEHALGMRTFLKGDWHIATRQLARAESQLRTRCTSVFWELGLTRYRYVAAVQIEGDMASVETELRDWLEDAERRDDREGQYSCLFGLGYCCLSNDQPEAVWPLVERVRAKAGDNHEVELGVSWLEAFTRCYSGATQSELQDSLERVRRVHRTMQGRVGFLRVWSRGYEASLLGALYGGSQGKERSRLLSQIKRLRAQLAKESWHYADCVVLCLDALLLHSDGRLEGAASALDRSAAIHAEHGAQLFAAVWRHASAVLRNNQADRLAAEQSMRALNVVDVERMARAHLPAFYPGALTSSPGDRNPKALGQ